MLHIFETISGFFLGLVANKRHQSRRKLVDHLTRAVHDAHPRWLCNLISRKLVIAGLKLQKNVKMNSLRQDGQSAQQWNRK